MMETPRDFHGNELKPLSCFKRAVEAMAAMHSGSSPGAYVIATNELARAFRLPTFNRTPEEKQKWDRIREAVWSWAYRKANADRP